MDKPRSLMYPLHQGYLIKSPPHTGLAGRMKSWRKRWFILWQDKSLEYSDERKGKWTKKIDLNFCTCLDGDLSHKKFANIFSIRINDGKSVDRTYFLVAETPYEMECWIKEICKLCDFDKEDETGHEPKSHETVETKVTTVSPPRDKTCPLSDTGIIQSGNTRDSGIHVSVSENNNNSDLIAVSPPVRSAYDFVPPRRELNEFDAGDYDVPPAHGNSNYDAVRQQPKPRLSPRNSCPLDRSSSSESSTGGNQNRFSGDSSEISDYDFPAHGQQCVYDQVPHPIPKPNMHNYANVTQGSCVEETYDVPPSQPTYDVVPARQQYPIIPPTTGMEKIDIYDHVPRQSSATSHYQSPSAKISNYDTVPTHGLPSAGNNSETYDYVPPPVQASSNLEQQIYDTVPHRQDNDDHLAQPTYDIVPPVPQAPKPTINTYVNLTIPSKESDTYNKPLPIPPHITGRNERDSGTVADFGSDDNNYDVPPKANTLPISLQPRQGPTVDRSSKPGTAAPHVNRSSKPGNTSKEYVNIPCRSSTFREARSYTPRSNVQRSKSSVGDVESDSGYLYMDSPRRTASSSRFSRKKHSLEAPREEKEEEDGTEYEYMEPQARLTDGESYENFNPQDLKLSKQVTDTVPVEQMKGHYQDIDIVCRRDVCRLPERHTKTNYTTIDIEKTRGFMKTREESSKGH